jgi:hypothetical protein
MNRDGLLSLYIFFPFFFLDEKETKNQGLRKKKLKIASRV